MPGVVLGAGGTMIRESREVGAVSGREVAVNQRDTQTWNHNCWSPLRRGSWGGDRTAPKIHPLQPESTHTVEILLCSSSKHSVSYVGPLATTLPSCVGETGNPGLYIAGIMVVYQF